MRNRLFRSRLLPAVALLWLSALAREARADLDLEATAVPGEPFGVGRVELELPRELLPPVLGVEGVRIVERNGRVLYPAIELRPVRTLLRNVLDRPAKATIYFLFRGSDRLELAIEGVGRVPLALTPRRDSRGHRELLEEWWEEYARRPGVLKAEPDYPLVVDNYLQSMLAYRLRLPLRAGDAEPSLEERLVAELGLPFGSERQRLALVRQRFLRAEAPLEPADRPLPEAAPAEELRLPPIGQDVLIEPIAERVPAECLYVRYGSFGNFLWFQDTLAQWGGDVQNLVALRGLDDDARGRIERRLVLSTSPLSRLLGDAVIADAAFVATDLRIADGTAFGLLFQARNNTLLTANLVQQRAERLQAGDGVVEQKLTIDGRPVSLLVSADGGVRSYYAADEGFHFVTTSETLVRRFLETGKATRSLGRSDDFRLARSMLPLERQDAVFIYLSDAFLRELSSLRYRIESARRDAALADMEIVQLAVLAAAAEGKPAGSVEELIEGGFLPGGFGARADGSRAVFDKGVVYDSLRGHRGALKPAVDVETSSATQEEVEAYGRLSRSLTDRLGRMPPVCLAVQRSQAGKGRQRIAVDLRLAPLSNRLFERLAEVVGPPEGRRLAPVPGDLVAFEAVLPQQRLFGGLADLRPPSPSIAGLILGATSLREMAVGYMGWVGQPGPLALADRLTNAPPDPAGFSRGRLGLWRRQYGEFVLYSFQPEVLQKVPPLLKYADTEREAQFWGRIEDVSQSRAAPMINRLGYARTYQTAAGNLRLLNQLETQLHVPGAHAREAAELILDARLVCPLGGEYEYRATSEDVGYWISTAMEKLPPPGPFGAGAPAQFVAPPLRWFRGLEIESAVLRDRAAARLEVEMESVQSD